MSGPATYGELMALARTSISRAGRSIATQPIGTPDAARSLLTARAGVIAATRDQTRALFGHARIDAVTSGNPLRPRPDRSRVIGRDPRTQRFLDWNTLADRLIDAAPEASAVEREHPATVHYHRASILIRAATDLLSTYQSPVGADLRLPPAVDTAILEPLRIAEALAGHPVYARCRQAGLPAQDANRALPLAAADDWVHATRALALALPPSAASLGDVVAAGVIRTERPSMEWTDRLTRLPARLRTIAVDGPIGVDTMTRIAHAALVSHHLRAGAGQAAEANPWFAVREQLRQWRSPIPVDPIILADVTRLSALARDAQRDPDAATSRHLVRAAIATTGSVADLADLANRLMPTVDRWNEATPVPAYLQRVRTPPHIAWRPTEPSLVWPTAAATGGGPAL